MTKFTWAYTQENHAALRALHAYIGRDTTNAFKEKGKVKPIKTLEKMPKIVPALARLWNYWKMPQDLITELEEFTCAVYGKTRFGEVYNLRWFMIREKCDDKSWMHCVMLTWKPCHISGNGRNNTSERYQVAVWNNSHISTRDIPAELQEHGCYTQIWNAETLMERRRYSSTAHSKSSMPFKEVLGADSDDDEDISGENEEISDLDNEW